MHDGIGRDVGCPPAEMRTGCSLKLTDPWITAQACAPAVKTEAAVRIVLTTVGMAMAAAALAFGLALAFAAACPSAGAAGV